MNPLASFSILIATAQNLIAAVNTRDNLHVRPPFARQSVAARLVQGLRVVRAFLRRLIILIALDMEWGLVDTRAAMKRPHGRTSVSSRGFNLKGLDPDKACTSPNGGYCHFATAFNKAGANRLHTPIAVDMAKLYAQLDYLARVAANPIAKAKRLAFHLARTRQGIIIAPQEPIRIRGYWGTQVSASYDGMAAAIITTSRNRPPPLPPPRTHWPSVTAF